MCQRERLLKPIRVTPCRYAVNRSRSISPYPLTCPQAKRPPRISWTESFSADQPVHIMMGELPDAEDSEIDYEFMYAHVPKENGYKGQLHQVIVGSTTLETQIGQLVETSLRELPETTRHLARLAKALVSRKLTALREAKIIDGVLCSDLLIVFRVRNQFAHSVAIL